MNIVLFSSIFSHLNICAKYASVCYVDKSNIKDATKYALNILYIPYDVMYTN